MRPAPGTVFAVLLALCLTAASLALAQTPCARPGTPQEAKALAEQAAKHLEKSGVRKAFTDFMNPDAGFMPHDLYVFVFDREGRMWVNGRFPDLIGSNIAGAVDTSGRRFLLDAMQRADKDGSAWVEYQWYNPCTGTAMAKSTHVVRTGPFFIGVGAYGRLSV